MSLEPRMGPRAVIRYLRLVETSLLAVLFASVALLPLLQILLRNVFATGFLWMDSFLRHAVLWLSLLGAARATLDGKHIRIDLVPRFLPQGSARAVELITGAFSFLVSLVLTYASWLFAYHEYQAGSRGVGSIPAWCLQLIFPVGFGLMAVRFAARSLTRLREYRARGDAENTS